ncbi:MAG TPA: hypothetical protein VGV06_07140 [Methylomirabilota bacterium]|nr:hypothetical protein [Methylomirabilota bacterium]
MATQEEESFRPFASLMREWLQAARLREMVRVLELVGEEFQSRGITLSWETTPPRQGRK